MMDVGTSVIGTGVVVTVGRWAQGKSLDIKQFVGIGVFAIGIAFVQQANQPFAEKFALMLFIAALMYYLVPITKKLGWTK